MNAKEAREINLAKARKWASVTIREITADVLRAHGDISLAQARKWAAAGYSNWRAACEVLTAEEVADAMSVGQRAYTDSLADAYEDASFADDGESAYGRED